MKKIMLAVAVLAFAVTASAGPAMSIKYRKVVAAGAVLNSDVLATGGADTVLATVDNSAGAGARQFSYKCLAADGTTALFTSADLAVTNLAPGITAVAFDPRSSVATVAAGQVVYPFLPCPKMSFHVAAAGAAAAAVTVYARPGVPLKLKYETSVAAGAVVTSPVFNTETIDQLVLLVNNSAGAGARVVRYKCLAIDGTTVVWTSPDVSVSNAAPGNAAIYLDNRVTTVTAATRQTIHPMPTCNKMQVTIDAAGAAAVGLAVYGR